MIKAMDIKSYRVNYSFSMQVASIQLNTIGKEDVELSVIISARAKLTIKNKNI